MEAMAAAEGSAKGTAGKLRNMTSDFRLQPTEPRLDLLPWYTSGFQ